MEPGTERRISLAQKWDQLVAEVRRIPDLGDFLRPTAGNLYLGAGSDGPVVIVNASYRRCDAIIVTPDRATAIELDGLTLDEVMRQANRYLKVIQHLDQSAAKLQSAIQEYLSSKGTRVERERLEFERGHLDQERLGLEHEMWLMLEWLWDSVAEPILTQLQLIHKPSSQHPLPRLWWCPTGAFTLLPLHAAGRRDLAASAVVERVISSYTPTLRALLQARKQAKRRGSPALSSDKMLVVAPSDIPGALPLASANKDITLLEQLMGSEQITVLNHASATRATVLDHISRYRWIHYSGHGTQDLRQPWAGGLSLADGTLTVRDMSLSNNACEFAFLSACKTATGGAEITNEVITLASALQYTGCQHVVASLWSVWDQAAAYISENLYSRLISNGRLNATATSLALHNAVTALRKSDLDRPSVWAPFVHIGP